MTAPEDVRFEKEEEQAQTNNFVLTAKNQINKFCNVLNLSFTVFRSGIQVGFTTDISRNYE